MILIISMLYKLAQYPLYMSYISAIFAWQMLQHNGVHITMGIFSSNVHRKVREELEAIKHSVDSTTFKPASKARLPQKVCSFPIAVEYMINKKYINKN